MAVQPITFAADTLLSWVPFYSSIKMLLVLALSFWRLEVRDLRGPCSRESSAFLFQTLVVPVMRRYEAHIDLTLLLIGSAALFVFHFVVEIPSRALVTLAKRASGQMLRTPAREQPSPRIATPPTPTPSRPARRASPLPEVPVVMETQKGPKRESLPHATPRKPRVPRKPEAETHHPSLAATKRSAVLVAKPGRVRAAAQAFEASSATSASDRDRPHATTSGRPKKAEDPSRTSGSRVASTRPTKAVRPFDKPAECRPVRPVPSSKTPTTKSNAHADKVRAALRTLPPAPSHDPRQLTAGTSQPSKSDNATASTSMPQAEPKRPARGQKRVRPDDEEYQDRDVSTARSAHAMTTRSTPRKLKSRKTSAGASPATRVTAPRQPAKRTRAPATTTTKTDTPRVKRARTSKK